MIVVSWCKSRRHTQQGCLLRADRSEVRHLRMRDPHPAREHAHRERTLARARRASGARALSDPRTQ